LQDAPLGSEDTVPLDRFYLRVSSTCIYRKVTAPVAVGTSLQHSRVEDELWLTAQAKAESAGRTLFDVIPEKLYKYTSRERLRGIK
jgi:hypothetical protein